MRHHFSMRLRRVDRSKPGMTRRRCGRGFTYLHPDGTRVRDAATLDRIRSLVIPPAWKEVWICPIANGHIQATGVDDAGRLQYLYHADWRVQRDRHKFENVLTFAQCLPQLRERCEHDLAASDDLTRERVLACAVRLLDRASLRVGTDEYATSNGSRGLATLHRDDVHVHGEVIELDYVGKSGQHLTHDVVDPLAAPVLKRLRRRRAGERLFAWRDRPGAPWVEVRSDDINEYLQTACCADCSAKDFRTWNATVLAAVGLAASAEAIDAPPTRRKRAVTRVVREVADRLGNTPAVCRASYIDPRVIDRFEQGRTVPLDGLGEFGPGTPAPQGAVERAVLQLLDEAPASE
jgi:DNA topoisomerase IB